MIATPAGEQAENFAEITGSHAKSRLACKSRRRAGRLRTTRKSRCSGGGALRGIRVQSLPAIARDLFPLGGLKTSLHTHARAWGNFFIGTTSVISFLGGEGDERGRGWVEGLETRRLSGPPGMVCGFSLQQGVLSRRKSRNECFPQFPGRLWERSGCPEASRTVRRRRRDPTFGPKTPSWARKASS